MLITHKFYAHYLYYMVIIRSSLLIVLEVVLWLVYGGRFLPKVKTRILQLNYEFPPK
jgi:hypothetical protein